jgi:hypothetical protein
MTLQHPDEATAALFLAGIALMLVAELTKRSVGRSLILILGWAGLAVFALILVATRGARRLMHVAHG